MTIDGLNILANKEPVVATHVGIFNEENLSQTYQRYRDESTTFVISPDIQRYQQQFILNVLDQQTTLACLVAPFGYGKTSTAINIWNACNEADLLAIPPFSCNSITEMGQSIATALIYRLEQDNQFSHADEIKQAFNKYLTSSANKLAEQDAKRYGISAEVAFQSIEDKIKSGHLHLEASATHLLSFIEDLVAITLDAGFKGLVIIVDEFQQFLGNINKGVITNFRTLIWGLQTRGELPLGFLITMDPDTERNLTDRGADILHRIRNHGLYLTFASIYDREFPRELWSRYAVTFGFTRDSSSIVDHATLDAIGQICERPDLSNGPRTVINIFQRIATLQSTKKQAYSPIDLINDFLTGDIRFDGDRGRIASLVNEISSYDYIKRSPSRLETIKLISAFPRGCPPEAAARYGLRDTFDYLLDELRGEILVELPEGVALVDLQKVGKPQNKLNIILKKYWLQITEQEIISDKALYYFARYGVHPLFPGYTSHQSGWRPETENFLLTPSGGYFRVYEGTFFEEYPQRRVATQICFDIADAVVPDGYIDAQFIFLIQEEGRNCSYIHELHGIPTYLIPISVHRPFNRHLPRDIREIESFLSPVVLTPGVLVSLLDYIVEQSSKIEGMSEQEYQRILNTHSKLQEFLLTMAISEETFEPYNIKILSRGAQAFRDALFNILSRLYGDYRTLFTGSGWRRGLEQYRQALENINNAQRRGIEPLMGKKSELALLFEQRQYAGFESYAKQYEGLLEVVDWRSDTGSIRFNRHHHENTLIEAISVDGGLSEAEVYAISRRQGYLDEETGYLISFLLLRGYIEYDESSKHFYLASAFTRDELINLARQITEGVHFLDQLQTNDLSRLPEQLNQLLASLEENKVDLSDAQVRLLQYQRHIQLETKQAVIILRSTLQGHIEQLYKYKARFETPLPESATGTLLDAHINGAQRTLRKDRSAAIARIEKRINSIRKTMEQSIDLEGEDFSSFQDYAIEVQKHTQLVAQEETDLRTLLTLCEIHHNWVQLVDKVKRLADMTSTVAHITDTGLLAKNIEQVQWDIQQELASEGLKQYGLIYERFAPSVNDLQREIETLVRLAETQARVVVPLPIQTATKISETAPINNAYQSADINLRNGSLETQVNLRAFFEETGKSEVDFLQLLIDLNEHGEILIYRK